MLMLQWLCLGKKISSTAIVFTDASVSSFGGCTALELVGCHISSIQWSEFEAAQSSTLSDFKAMFYILQSFAMVLPHLKVK